MVVFPEYPELPQPGSRADRRVAAERARPLRRPDWLALTDQSDSNDQTPAEREREWQSRQQRPTVEPAPSPLTGDRRPSARIDPEVLRHLATASLQASGKAASSPSPPGGIESEAPHKTQAGQDSSKRTEDSAVADQIVAELLRVEEEENKRRFERRELRAPVEFIPLTERGLRYDAARIAEMRNISAGGVALVLDEPPMEPRWAVRLDLGSHAALLEVVVRHIHRTDDDRFFLACQFVRRLDTAE